MAVGKKEEDQEQEQEDVCIPPTAALVFTASALASLPAFTSCQWSLCMNEAWSNEYFGALKTKTVKSKSMISYCRPRFPPSHHLPEWMCESCERKRVKECKQSFILLATTTACTFSHSLCW